jgi:hypothetical protein
MSPDEEQKQVIDFTDDYIRMRKMGEYLDKNYYSPDKQMIR